MPNKAHHHRKKWIHLTFLTFEVLQNLSHLMVKWTVVLIRLAVLMYAQEDALFWTFDWHHQGRYNIKLEEWNLEMLFHFVWIRGMTLKSEVLQFSLQERNGTCWLLEIIFRQVVWGEKKLGKLRWKSNWIFSLKYIKICVYVRHLLGWVTCYQ